MTYACCEHCEHENGHRHLDPCEDESCEGAQLLSLDCVCTETSTRNCPVHGNDGAGA